MRRVSSMSASRLEERSSVDVGMRLSKESTRTAQLSHN